MNIFEIDFKLKPCSKIVSELTPAWPQRKMFRYTDRTIGIAWECAPLVIRGLERRTELDSVGMGTEISTPSYHTHMKVIS
jgi:hypothetical protein